VDAAEAAVAEHHHHVAALRVLAEVLHDGVRVRQIRRRLAGRADVACISFLRVQPLLRRQLLQPRHLGDDHRVGVGKGRGQLAWKTFRRVVLLRGSNTAQIFSRAYLMRKARSVSRMAVG
jgi:hypothetical protein